MIKKTSNISFFRSYLVKDHINILGVSGVFDTLGVTSTKIEFTSTVIMVMGLILGVGVKGTKAILVRRTKTDCTAISLSGVLSSPTL